MNPNENIAYNGKLGIFSWFGWRLHISQRAKLIKDAGFDTTCLWWAEDERANTGSLDDLPGIVRDNGLEIDNVHVPFAEAHLLSSENQSEREEMINRHKKWLEDCARHKIPKLVFHVCPAYENPPPPADVLLDSIAEMVEFAQQAKVILAAENTRRCDYVDFVLGRIDSEYLRFCYDSGHDVIWSDEQIAVLKRWGHKLIMTHLHDNKGVDDDHLIPFTGKIEWRKVFSAWPKDYKGPLMLEVVGNPESQPPDVFLKRAFENLTRLKNLKI